MKKLFKKENERRRCRRGSDLIMDKYIHTEKDLNMKEISSINRLIQYCEDPIQISSVFSVLDITQIMGRIYFYKNHQGARKALIHACSLTISKERPGREKAKTLGKFLLETFNDAETRQTNEYINLYGILMMEGVMIML